MLVLLELYWLSQAPYTPDDAKNAQRHVEQEDETPRPLREQAADDWAYQEARRPRYLVYAQAKSNAPLRKASVTMAVLFVTNKAPPTPWISRPRMRSTP